MAESPSPDAASTDAPDVASAAAPAARPGFGMQAWRHPAPRPIGPLQSPFHFMLGALLAVGTVAAWVLVRVAPVGISRIYPPCVLYQQTGWFCSGCGATRAVSAALHGDVAQAIAYNLPITLLLPVGALWMASLLWQGITGRPLLRLRLRYPIAVTVAICTFVVLFSVLRNLPWMPFTLLAPHELLP